MKSLIAALAAISVLLVGACSLPPIKSAPPAPHVTFVIESHDVSDFQTSLPIEIILKASALNPDLIGAFEEPDTGVSYPLRDPVTRVDLPVPLSKHTPYSAPIYFPAGEIINFTVTVAFFGHYGDVVLCYFRDSLDREIGGTRQASGIYDQSLRDTRTIEAPGTVTCNYSGTSA